ncbi:MAG: hypothetical protein Q7T54_05820, partial [Candidatus Levybacteria bacterium]|nr:hypothetical protein [Candidatus Levybacteria bacterium]
MSSIKKSQEIENESASQVEEVTSVANDREYEPQQRSNNRQDQATEVVAGILDIKPEGHGFLRPKF